jgi:hypothetical protein
MSSDDTYLYAIGSPWSLTKVISVAIRNLCNMNVTTEMVTVCLLKNVEGSYDNILSLYVERHTKDRFLGESNQW